MGLKGDLEVRQTTSSDGISDRLMASLALGEASLGLPRGSLIQLHNDPDYMFMIKVVAIIEPIINDLIEEAFLRPSGGLGGKPVADRFQPVADFAIERLNLSGRSGKIELARRLSQITTAEAKCIEELCFFRNKYAHNIRNANRPLIGLFKERMALDAGSQRRLAFGQDTTISIDDGGSQLRLTILLGLASILTGATGKLLAKPGLIEMIESILGSGTLSGDLTVKSPPS